MILNKMILTINERSLSEGIPSIDGEYPDIGNCTEVDVKIVGSSSLW